tara:strand:+ start:113 stop:586 length:474 start_codon:yes stop_codon:yes gene_type:complete
MELLSLGWGTPLMLTSTPGCSRNEPTPRMEIFLLEYDSPKWRLGTAYCNCLMSLSPLLAKSSAESAVIELGVSITVDVRFRPVTITSSSVSPNDDDEIDKTKENKNPNLVAFAPKLIIPLLRFTSQRFEILIKIKHFNILTYMDIIEYTQMAIVKII